MADGKAKRSVAIYDNGTYTQDLPLFGWVTSGGTLGVAYILTKKSLSGKTVSNVSVTDLGQLRMGYGGYINYTASNVPSEDIGSNYFRIAVTKSGGYGVTNNATFFGFASVTFTVS